MITDERRELRDDNQRHGQLPERPLYYSVKEAAAVLRISRSTLYRYVKTGHITMLKVGRRSVFHRNHLEGLITSPVEQRPGERRPGGEQAGSAPSLKERGREMVEASLNERLREASLQERLGELLEAALKDRLREMLEAALATLAAGRRHQPRPSPLAYTK